MNGLQKKQNKAYEMTQVQTIQEGAILTKEKALEILGNDYWDKLLKMSYVSISGGYNGTKERLVIRLPDIDTEEPTSFQNLFFREDEIADVNERSKCQYEKHIQKYKRTLSINTDEIYIYRFQNAKNIGQHDRSSIERRTLNKEDFIQNISKNGINYTDEDWINITKKAKGNAIKLPKVFLEPYSYDDIFEDLFLQITGKTIADYPKNIWLATP